MRWGLEKIKNQCLIKLHHMKNIKIVVLIALFACILVFLMTILDFLALHDIFNDYSSPKVIERFCAVSQTSFPAWTKTSGEWQMVNISYVTRFFFFIFNMVVLILCLKKMRSIKTLSDK
jgi:hypothetical protein